MRRMWVALLAAVLFSGVAASVYAQGTVPAGTAIIVTLDESVSSKDARTGQKVAGSVSDNIVVNGKTVIPKGSRVTLSVAKIVASGRLQTPAELWLKINSIEAKGQTYALSSNWSGQKGPSHNKRNVVAIGGGTAAGAIIGAIAGGGKGAAIGAAVGAGAGTAGAAMTGKKDIFYPAETKLRFTTKTALTMK